MLFAGNLNFRVLHKSEIIKMKYRWYAVGRQNPTLRYNYG